jgi:hypothetical protein
MASSLDLLIRSGSQRYRLALVGIRRKKRANFPSASTMWNISFGKWSGSFPVGRLKLAALAYLESTFGNRLRSVR